MGGVNVKYYDCFIDTTGSWLRTCMHHDGEEIDLGMQPGDIYSSSASATKQLCDPGNKFTSLSFSFFDYHTQGLH